MLLKTRKSAVAKLEEFSTSRLNFILVGFFLLFIFVDLRLFKIQVLEHALYATQAQNQYGELQVIPARRGNIVSSDGYILAGTRNNYLLYAEPKKLTDVYKTAHELSLIVADLKIKKFMATPEATSTADLAKYQAELTFTLYTKYLENLKLNLLWVPLEKDLVESEKQVIEHAGIVGLGFEEAPVRYYPEGTLAAHVLGFVGSDEKGEKTGYYGIEGALNDDLKGKSGRMMEETDARGLPILVGSYKKIEPVEGRNVKLTINRAVEYLVEKQLALGVAKYDASSGSVIVMDPTTGDILALANYPTYEPQNFGVAQKPQPDHANRMNIERVDFAISHTYEPGSVIKPLTISSALDLHLVTPTTTFEDNAPAKYSDYYINNWDGKHHGTQTIIELLQKSNNIGAAWVGTKVGAENLSTYFSLFGLGKRTGVDLEGEDTGVINDYTKWTDIDLATASFGQGISATPLQVLTAFNVFPNGGRLLKPKIIESIGDDSRELEIPTKVVAQVISKQTASTMVSLLEQAVEGGEAKYFVLKDYRIAGKTGTAQIPENGKYAPDKTNATFVGFMAGSKKFTMIVKLQEPKTSIYAAETAVPLWMAIAGDLVKYYGIPADKFATPLPPVTSAPAVTQARTGLVVDPD